METTQTTTRPALSAQAAAVQGAWNVPLAEIAFDEADVRSVLLRLDRPVYAVRVNDRIGLTHSGQPSAGGSPVELLGQAGPLSLDQLGDPAFRETYGLKFAYAAGAMANGIASVELVIELGKAGFLGSFGAAGLTPPRIEEAIRQIQAALPDGPYMSNIIHNPNEPAMERGVVDLYLRMGVRVVEASAFLSLTPNLVHYRAAGLSQAPDGSVVIGNRIIAKISRKEVAIKFMQPAPEKILAQLVEEGRITPDQARLAARVPVADDITVEADSGGHTDNRPLVVLFPSILALRDEVQEQYGYAVPVRIGAAGGIATPAAALAAFQMGAAYIMTGSVNQACLEAGTSDHTRALLAKAASTDVIMAPAADMFEMGVRVQVLKAGTLFAMRAAKLYDLYTRYESIEQIPADEREKVEKQILQRTMDSVWNDCEIFFTERDPEQIQKAHSNPKKKMALIFRWYLGLSSRWSNTGQAGREMDYQIWCGPAMGAFNDWTRATYLAEPANRRAVDIARHLLTGAAYQYRVEALRLQGVQPVYRLATYRPLAQFS